MKLLLLIVILSVYYATNAQNISKDLKAFDDKESEKYETQAVAQNDKSPRRVKSAPGGGTKAVGGAGKKVTGAKGPPKKAGKKAKKEKACDKAKGKPKVKPVGKKGRTVAKGKMPRKGRGGGTGGKGRGGRGKGRRGNQDTTGAPGPASADPMAHTPRPRGGYQEYPGDAPSGGDPGSEPESYAEPSGNHIHHDNHHGDHPAHGGHPCDGGHPAPGGYPAHGDHPPAAEPESHHR